MAKFMIARNLQRAWGGARSGFARLSSALVLLAALCLLWLTLVFHLIGFGTHY